jgi:site-specific recombinase XerD
MTPRSIGLAIDRRRRQAQLLSLSTHDFRRTLAGSFLRSGGDVVQLQQLLGHASLTTTASYDPRPGEEIRASIDRLTMAAGSAAEPSAAAGNSPARRAE